MAEEVRQGPGTEEEKQELSPEPGVQPGLWWELRG